MPTCCDVKNILANANAARTVAMIQDEVQSPKNFSHLVSLTHRHASAIVIAIPSSPTFAFTAQDFALALRMRMQLPCGLTPIADIAAHELLEQPTVRTAVHNALRDQLLCAAALSDHHIRAEPRKIYNLPQNSTVDGVVEATEATGIVTSVIHQRSAFDVFTAKGPEQVLLNSNRTTIYPIIKFVSGLASSVRCEARALSLCRPASAHHFCLQQDSTHSTESCQLSYARTTGTRTCSTRHPTRHVSCRRVGSAQ